jgi:hypothetical protein
VDLTAVISLFRNRDQTLVLDPGLGAKIFTKLTNLLCFSKKSSVVVSIEVRNLFYFFIVKGTVYISLVLEGLNPDPRSDPHWIRINVEF